MRGVDAHALSHKGSQRCGLAFCESGRRSISEQNKELAKSRLFREAQYEWECGDGVGEASLSQDRLDQTRYRGRAPRGRHDRVEVAHSAAVLCEAHPGLSCEMGKGCAGSHLAGAARRSRTAM